ncbi:hypothetical protein C2G38_2126053, partial [Gigaspora rosea]
HWDSILRGLHICFGWRYSRCINRRHMCFTNMNIIRCTRCRNKFFMSIFINKTSNNK